MGSSINIFQRLRDLVPLPVVYVGTVLEIHDDYTSTVEIPGPPVVGYAGNVAVGSIMRPRGASVPVGHRAFVRAGVIETEAPSGDIIDIEVGKVILPPYVPPEPADFVWLDTFTGAAGALFGHVPDIKPTGWEWAPDDPGLELDGVGSAVTSITGGVTAGSGGSWAPIEIPGGAPWRVEFDVTLTDEPGFATVSSVDLYMDETGDSSGGFFDLQISRTNEGEFLVSLGYGGSTGGFSGDVVAAAGGAHAFVVEISGSGGATVKMDGATILTATSASVMSQVALISVYIDNEDAQAHTIQRGALWVGEGS